MKCKHCGKEIDNDSRFCEYCGKKVKTGRLPWWAILLIVLYSLCNVVAVVWLILNSTGMLATALGEENAVSVGYVTDYDGNEYNTVQIGNQCWMAENMRTTHSRDGKAIAAGGTNSSVTELYRYAPDNNSDNVEQYGYLYNWAAAQEVCPEGWHLPTKEDFEELQAYCGEHYAVGGDKEYIAKALASKNGWESSNDTYSPGNTPSSNNASGFSAVPAGYYYDGSYGSFGDGAYLWSATPYGSVSAYELSLGYGYKGTYLNSYYRYLGFSVRCLRDK